MADIFVSYARQDKDRVARLVAALAAQGWSIWWDPEITPGQEFDRLINEELRAAKAVIVVWTPASVESRWVRGEARIAAERGVLVPVRFERANLPIDAMAMHTTDLDDWNGNADHAGFQGLVRGLRVLASRGPAQPATAVAAQPASAAPTPNSVAAQSALGMNSKYVVPALAIALTAAAAIAFMVINRGGAPQDAATKDPTQLDQSQAASVSDGPLMPAPAKPRLAVLPFRNLSPDPSNAFFTDGMHEEILSTLATRARGLEIISATTMLTYKERSATIDQVARDLACTHVLEGSVRREGNEVRLTLQLIDARTDEHVWAQDYDRTLTNALALQSEVAGEVAQELSAQLIGGQGTAPTKNPEAYDLYLKARLVPQSFNPGLSNQEIVGAIRNMQSLLSQAIAADPSFGLAYLARAQSHYFEAELSTPPFAPLDPAALSAGREDLNTAARLLGEKDARVVAFRTVIEANTVALDPQKAMAALDAADASHITDTDVLRTKTQFYSIYGRLAEAIEVMRGLVALDPANIELLLNYQVLLQAAHRPAEAMKIYNIIVSRPDAPPILSILRAQTILNWTGDTAPLKAAIDELGPRVDPDVLLNIKGNLLSTERRFDEYKAHILSTRAAGTRYFLNGIPISASLPTAILQGFAALLTGDAALGKTAGEALIAGAQSAPNFSRAVALATAAEGHAFAGEKKKAVEAAREALKIAPDEPSALARRIVDAACAVALAWSGAGDEAVEVLERSSTADWGMAPAEITRQPIFDIPLADNPRYLALKAKLEAQMAATRLE